MTRPDPIDTAKHAAQRMYMDTHTDIDRALYDFLFARQLAVHVCGGDPSTQGYHYAMRKRDELTALLRSIGAAA